MPVRKHLIELSTAKQMVAAHAAHAKHGEVKNLTLPREVFELLLAVPGCVDIRAHLAVHPSGHKTLVYTAVDADGADLLDPVTITLGNAVYADAVVVIDESRPCPPLCGSSKLYE